MSRKEAVDTVVDHPNQALLDLLAPYIAELDLRPRPNRIDSQGNIVEEYGCAGDQHCPTMPMNVWNELTAVEPFASDPKWEYLRTLKNEAIGPCREIPGAWLRRAYNCLADRKG